MNSLDKFLLTVAPGLAAKRQENIGKALLLDRQVQRMRDRDDVERSYEGASTGRRGASFAGANNQSANKEINRYNRNLRERQRFLFKNTPSTKRAVRVIANNTVGLGIIPTPVGNENFIKKLSELWAEWGEDSTCDWNDKGNFYFLEKLTTKTVAQAGECYALRRRVKSDVNKLGIQIMLLEPEFLDNGKNEESTKSGGFIQNGIEYDADGKIKGYWFFTIHPDIKLTDSKFFDKKDVCHVHEVDRPGQDRGVPMGSANMLTERDLDNYKDSEIMAKATGASFAGFVVNQDPSKIEEGGDSDEYDDVGNMKIEPGTMYKLYPGEDVKFSTPPISNGIDGFVRIYQRDIATGWGITYEQQTGDYSQVNFSSGRMGWIEFSRNVDDWQWMMIIEQFCKKAYKWFLEACMVYLSIKELPKDFRVTWTTPRREMIDPYKEILAIKEQLKAGLISWQEVVRMQSYIPKELFEELKKDTAQFKAADIQPDWMIPKQPPVVKGKDETTGK